MTGLRVRGCSVNTQWLEKLVQELKETARALDALISTPPNISFDWLKSQIGELKQASRTNGKSVEAKPVLAIDFSWVKPTTDFFSTYLRAEKRRKVEVVELPTTEIKFNLDWLDESLRELEDAMSITIQPIIEVSFRFDWINKAVKEIETALTPEPRSKFKFPEPHNYNKCWEKQFSALKKAIEVFRAPIKIITAPQPKFFWLVSTCRDLQKALRHFESSQAVELPEPTSFNFRWLRCELGRLSQATAKYARVKSEVITATTTPDLNWLRSMVSDLRSALGQKVESKIAKEISWERSFFPIPNPFPQQDKKSRRDKVVERLTTDRERIDEANARMEHCEPTYEWKKKSRSKRSGYMPVIGIATRKVNTHDAKGRRVVYYELQNDKVRGSIDLSDSFVACWRKFDPTIGQMVVVGEERGIGIEGWLAQQEELATRIDPRFSKNLGKKSMNLEGKEAGEACVPLATPTGTRFVSFAQYLEAEGKTVNGVCAELRRKYEV